MKLLITGGAGFIGSNLARSASEIGYQITVIDDLSTGYRSNLQGLDVDFVEGSILDRDLMAEVSADQHAIVHLAALGSVPRSIADPEQTHEVNATGTLRVLEAARGAGVSHTVVASSSSVYGANEKLPKNEHDWVSPMSPYAVSKLATEQYALAYAKSFGMATLAFRFFNVYGPRQPAGHAYAAVVPTFIDAILRGEPVWINGDGSFSRDFTYVETVTRVLLSSVENRTSSAIPVNLAFGTRTTIGDLAKHLAGMTSASADIRHRPNRPGDVAHSQADNSELQKLFPGVAAVGLDEGLRATVAWFKEGMR